MKRLDPSGYQRILIVATRQIGDVLCTTPLMRRAREIWPSATIDVLGYEKTMGMLKGNPDVNDVIESSEHPKWPEYKQLLKRIFRRYDLAIVTQASDRAHIYGMLAAPRRVGIVPQARVHNWWKKLLSLHTVELDYWKQHVVIERLRLLEPFTAGPLSQLTNSRSVLVVAPAAEELPADVSDWLEGRQYVVIHATPMWRFKRWPTQHWASLIDWFVRKDWRVVLTGSASSQDCDLNEEILSRVSESGRGELRNLAGRLNLGQMTRLLSGAVHYVGVDTSITHQAAAVGIKTIAIFGPTPPTNFGPWPQGRDTSAVNSPWALLGQGIESGPRMQRVNHVTVVQGPGRCVPCRKAGCLDRFESHSNCLDGLVAQDVMTVIES